MTVTDKHPTLTRVLGSLSSEQKLLLHEHSQTSGFHRGRQWFGTGMRVGAGAPMETKGGFTLSAVADSPCPVAAAFDVGRDFSKTGWYSAKLDERLLAAIKHIIDAAGDAEDGMEQYLKELENTDPVELNQIIELQYLAVSASKE